jgi:hypothetical protein
VHWPFVLLLETVAGYRGKIWEGLAPNNAPAVILGLHFSLVSSLASPITSIYNISRFHGQKMIKSAYGVQFMLENSVGFIVFLVYSQLNNLVMRIKESSTLLRERAFLPTGKSSQSALVSKFCEKELSW